MGHLFGARLLQLRAECVQRRRCAVGGRRQRRARHTREFLLPSELKWVWFDKFDNWTCIVHPQQAHYFAHNTHLVTHRLPALPPPASPRIPTATASRPAPRSSAARSVRRVYGLNRAIVFAACRVFAAHGVAPGAQVTSCKIDELTTHQKRNTHKHPNR